MDNNASFQQMLRFERPDKLCLFEWGYWPDTVKRWQSEGMKADHAWEELDITYYHRVPVETRFYPTFETEVLSTNGNSQVIRDDRGIVKEVLTDGYSMPRFISHPVTNMRDFEQLKERLQPDDPGRFPANWADECEKLRNRNSILVMGGTEISFFGWHRDLMGAENLLMAYYDQPELIHAISQHHVYFIQELYSRLLKDVEFDFVFFWEDMSYKNGPLISPAMMREFMLPYYKQIIGFFREFGDMKFLVDSDGDVSELIPLFIEAGVDGMLPFEVAAGMDVVSIAEQYPDFIIAGGIDKREIAKGHKAIDHELERVLPPLFKRGGYLPSMDHHVPPEVSYADFQYYLERIREYWRKWGR
jgi:uroporphyrinogen-III decarboxylase